jgi:hypothetical protein
MSDVSDGHWREGLLDHREMPSRDPQILLTQLPASPTSPSEGEGRLHRTVRGSLGGSESPHLCNPMLLACCPNQTCRATHDALPLMYGDWMVRPRYLHTRPSKGVCKTLLSPRLCRVHRTSITFAEQLLQSFSCCTSSSPSAQQLATTAPNARPNHFYWLVPAIPKPNFGHFRRRLSSQTSFGARFHCIGSFLFCVITTHTLLFIYINIRHSISVSEQLNAQRLRLRRQARAGKQGSRHTDITTSER